MSTPSNKGPKKSARRGVRAAREELYRAAILDAAERVFAEQTYDGARMQTIASEAGVALGTLYKVFAGKQALVDAIHERRGDELISSAAATADLAGEPFDAVLNGIEVYIRYLAAHPNYLRIHLHGGHAWALGTDYVSPVQARQFDAGLQLIGAFFTRARGRWELRAAYEVADKGTLGEETIEAGYQTVNRHLTRLARQQCREPRGLSEDW